MYLDVYILWLVNEAFNVLIHGLKKKTIFLTVSLKATNN